MKAKQLSGILKKGDRVAVSNITGREAQDVSVTSQIYAGNIVGGWALGKGDQKIEVPGQQAIPVFGTCEELYKHLSKSKRPNKIVIYSPPEAVYGEVKKALQFGGKELQTIFVITEHVSVEVTSKIKSLCDQARVDVIGCNTLGVINTHDHVRVGAVGGDTPEESFVPGSATIISNSGNMVNTIATYMLTAGIGTHFGISTGKDVLILTQLTEFLKLIADNAKTKLVVLYVEPGGLHEKTAIEWMKKNKFSKPVIVYVAGSLMEGRNVSLGHAGAVVEGTETSATGKMKIFDEYFGIEPFNPVENYSKPEFSEKLKRGIRVTTLHHLPQAAMTVGNALGWKKDFPIRQELKLNPWFVNYRHLNDKLPSTIFLMPGVIPEPYASQFKRQLKETIGLVASRRDMRNASFASSIADGEPRIYGYPATKLMENKSFGEALILYWAGELPRYDFEARLVEMLLVASLTNGPGTISAQGAKLSASAGNNPNTAMIATLAATGAVHGGNGAKAVRFLIENFKDAILVDPYEPGNAVSAEKIAKAAARKFKKIKDAAKEAGVDYERIPCVGHPVYNKDPVNYDPREQAVCRFIAKAGKHNVFLDFYHELVKELCVIGVSSKVWAVNVDAAIACIWLAICWASLMEKKITLKRVEDCAFLGFALGRAAGGAGEFLDHQDFGAPMDMRISPAECHALTQSRELE